MDARRQVELQQTTEYPSTAWSWRCQRGLVPAGNIEDDSLETLVLSLWTIPLSFQFPMRSPVFTWGGREKLYLLYLKNSGKACVIGQKATSSATQRHHSTKALPRSIPRSQPASAAFAGKTKMSGFGKGSPAHSTLVQYQGRITALALLVRLQLCTSGPDISFAG